MYHFITTGSQRTTCHTCTNGHRSACCCCRPSALVLASPGWCFAMKTSKCKEKIKNKKTASRCILLKIFFQDMLLTCFMKPNYQLNPGPILKSIRQPETQFLPEGSCLLCVGTSDWFDTWLHLLCTYILSSYLLISAQYSSQHVCHL